MTDKFIPNKDAVSLSAHAAAMMRASSDLIGTITEDLPEEKRVSLLAVLAGGGRVGLEVTVDRNAENRLSLIAIEREGHYRVLATITTIDINRQKLAH